MQSSVDESFPALTISNLSLGSRILRRISDIDVRRLSERASRVPLTFGSLSGSETERVAKPCALTAYARGQPSMNTTANPAQSFWAASPRVMTACFSVENAPPSQRNI